MPKLKLGPTYKFMRIVVAMSGGVDSSVAAALLHEAGHAVVGLSMQLYDQREATGHGFGRCCSLDDLHDARRVAASIGIKHYVLNLERQFKDTVIANFVGEYAAGRTPIPCTHCNSDLKFSTLVDRAAGFDASTVGTGHYAQLSDDPQTGRRRLLRGRDASKDQSYFLFALTQQQLQAATFPVGGLTKPEVRAYARERGLPVADKPDSQEICFVPDGDYAQFVERHAPDAIGSGAITDANGRVLGRHDGVHRFTVGQRKGLRLSTSEPLYVLELRPTEQAVVVGHRHELERVRCEVANVNWTAGEIPTKSLKAAVQVRHRHVPGDATVTPLEDGRAAVVFENPERAISPGQAAVFYEGNEVIGGGWIC
jgi:tRNA-uridine 2-sulfurtransferase